MGRKGRHSPLIRREYIKQYWFKHSKPPSIEHLQELWPLKRRTFHKDLNAVIDEIKDPDVVGHIRTKFLWELNTRIPEMEDRDFVKITKHFISEKSEVKTEGETTLKVGVEDDLGAFIEEYLPIIVELLLDEQDNNGDADSEDTTSGLDAPQTDAETDEIPPIK